MVRSIIYTATAIALCVAFFIFTEIYVGEQFGCLTEAAAELRRKTEEGEASEDDALAVQALWDDKKSKLHIFIPHNDIAQIDYCLSEARGHLAAGNAELALAKIETVVRLSRSLPFSYSVRLENVF